MIRKQWFLHALHVRFSFRHNYLTTMWNNHIWRPLEDRSSRSSNKVEADWLLCFCSRGVGDQSAMTSTRLLTEAFCSNSGWLRVVTLAGSEKLVLLIVIYRFLHKRARLPEEVVKLRRRSGVWLVATAVTEKTQEPIRFNLLSTASWRTSAHDVKSLLFPSKFLILV